MTSRHFRRLFLGFCLLAFVMGGAMADNAFSVSTPAFPPGMGIPTKYGFHEQNVSPEVQIKNVPANARSLMLIVDDPDSPSGLWTHWLVWNIPPDTADIPEGAVPTHAIQGKNSFGNVRYDGPTPPSGMHRYYFRLSALNTGLTLPTGSGRAALEQAAKGHVIAETETFGTYRAGQTAAK